MGIAIVIVLGLIALTLVAVAGDGITKIGIARAKAGGQTPSGELDTLRRRVEALESRVEERDENVRKLQDELRFVTRMLEDKTAERGS
jgi:chromosome segregation ATPase